MDKLNLLLLKYQEQLQKDAGIAATANVIEPSVVLIALEEMLGVDCGGENLGEALEHWLSLPPKKRKPMQFADLKKKWDAQEQEMLAMVERDLANLP